MSSICFYFQVHQPLRLRIYRFFEIGRNHNYYDDYKNREIIRRVADKCYIPTNKLMFDLINEYGKAFRISYSISGIALDQFEMYTPDVIKSFQKLAKTGCVEFLSETYSHSLCSLKSKDEFVRQVEAHKERIEDLFGQTPVTFRNTELVYSDKIGEMVSEMGFKTMITEGAKHILGWKSPNYLYCNAINPKLKLLLKNYQLSDDIAFRFSQQSWKEWPLTAEKFLHWLTTNDPKEEVINLFMDYETFGEHQWPETGIFEFLKALPKQVFQNSNLTFNTPSELSKTLQPVSSIHVPYPISWADEERDLSAWLGNELQEEAFNKLYSLEKDIKHIKDNDILSDWKYLQTSDHFYYMCTKWFSDGDVHKYFNPYNTPYEAFINYMNILSDFIIRINNYKSETPVLHKEAVNEEKKKTVRKAAKQVKKFKTEVKTKAVKSKKIIAKKPVSKPAKKPVKTTVKKSVTKKPLIKKTEFTFNSLLELTQADLKKVLKDIDIKGLANVLYKKEEELKEKIIKALPKTAIKEYKEIEAKLKKVDSSEITKIVSKLEDKFRKLFISSR